jgi:hypothetical protein
MTIKGTAQVTFEADFVSINHLTALVGVLRGQDVVYMYLASALSVIQDFLRAVLEHSSIHSQLDPGTLTFLQEFANGMSMQDALDLMKRAEDGLDAVKEEVNGD